jgi:hypothetical protein
MNTTELLIRHEVGDLVFSETIHLFAELVRSGRIKKLNATYYNKSLYYIHSNLITRSGEVNHHVLRKYIK